MLWKSLQFLHPWSQKIVLFDGFSGVCVWSNFVFSVGVATSEALNSCCHPQADVLVFVISIYAFRLLPVSVLPNSRGKFGK